MKKLVTMCFVIAMVATATVVQAADSISLNASNCWREVKVQHNPDYYGEVPFAGQVITVLSNAVEEVFAKGPSTNRIAKWTITWKSQLGGDLHVMKNVDYYPPNNTSAQGVATTGVYAVVGTYPDLAFIKVNKVASPKPKKD